MSDKPVRPAGTPDSEPEGQGFLSRWSRRKSQVREGQTVAPKPVPAAFETHAPPPAVPTVGVHASARPAAAPMPAALPADTAPDQPQAAAPPPTLEDVEKLTAQSDFSRFTSPGVDPQVRNAAMRKLFHTEPQFNVMDGLDVYIDDYNTPDPLPKAIMRTMLQARALGLLDDELKEQEHPDERLPSPSQGSAVDTLDTPGTPGELSTERPMPACETAEHENADLQLQPDDAAGHPGPDEVAGNNSAGGNGGDGQPRRG